MKVDSCTNLLDFSKVCPLQADQFAYELKNPHNQPMVANLLKGIREGFEIGYDGPEISREISDLKSARDHPEVVLGYLGKECQRGRIGGPFEEPPFPICSVMQ